MSYQRSATLEALGARAALLARIRAFFADRGVLEVETPSLSSAAVTDPALHNIQATVERLGGSQFLHTSPEFAMKRLLVSGSGDIYQICRVYRDGELGRWHEPEFTLLEWYRTGWDDGRLMDEVADLVSLSLGATGHNWPVERITYRDAFVNALGLDPMASSRELPHRIQACLAAHGIDVPPNLDVDALLDLAFSTVIQPHLAPRTLSFVYDYPASQAALARLKPGAPPVAARFELFAGGIELANGFAELTDPDEQRRRFEQDLRTREKTGQPVLPMDGSFLAALEAGLPDSAGVAIGVDRLVALATGASSLAEVVAFTHRHHPAAEESASPYNSQ